MLLKIRQVGRDIICGLGAVALYVAFMASLVGVMAATDGCGGLLDGPVPNVGADIKPWVRPLPDIPYATYRRVMDNEAAATDRSGDEF